jgi:DNA-binding protein Fis
MKIKVTIEIKGRRVELIDPTLEEVDRNYVRMALEACGDNRTHAAPLMGIHLRSVHRMIDRWREVTRRRWNRKR